MYHVLFTFGRLLYITYLLYVPGMVYVWKAAIHYIIYSIFDFTYFSTVVY